MECGGCGGCASRAIPTRSRIADAGQQRFAPRRPYCDTRPELGTFAARRTLAAVAAAAVTLCGWAASADATTRLTALRGFNGEVRVISLADANGTRYVGGYFTAVNPWDTGGGAGTDAATGAVSAVFPKVSGTIRAVAPDGRGGFYIGGSFGCLGPNPDDLCTGPDDVRRSNLAHISGDGSVLPWSPTVNNDVSTILVSGGTVYIGGSFTTVNAQPRGRGAAVSADGTLLPWNPNANQAINAIALLDGIIYTGGDFTTAGPGATARPYAAAFTPEGSLTGWNPRPNNPVYAVTAANGMIAARQLCRNR